MLTGKPWRRYRHNHRLTFAPVAQCMPHRRARRTLSSEARQTRPSEKDNGGFIAKLFYLQIDGNCAHEPQLASSVELACRSTRVYCPPEDSASRFQDTKSMASFCVRNVHLHEHHHQGSIPDVSRWPIISCVVHPLGIIILCHRITIYYNFTLHVVNASYHFIHEMLAITYHLMCQYVLSSLRRGTQIPGC